MTSNSRIKEIRKSLGLTQIEFGERICISQGQLTSIENGKSSVTDRTVKLICTEFHVNETWLRTGEGSMFTEQTRDDEIAAFVSGILRDRSDFRYRLIGVLSRLSPDEWALLEKKINELTVPDSHKVTLDAVSAELQAEDQPPTSSASPIGEESAG